MFLFVSSDQFLISLKAGVAHFFTEYGTGPCLISHSHTSLTSVFYTSVSDFPSIVPIQEPVFNSIKEYLNLHTDISLWTPLSIYEMGCMKPERERIRFFCKVIEPFSFSQVFDHIILPLDEIAGVHNAWIILPPYLKETIDMLHGSISEDGDVIIAGDRLGTIWNTSMASVLEPVSYKDGQPLLTHLAYCHKEIPTFFYRQGVNTPSDEKKISLYRTFFQQSPDNIFNNNLFMKQTVITEESLDDSFFFEIITPSTEKNAASHSENVMWHYIIVRPRKGIPISVILDDLNQYIKNNNLDLKAAGWETYARNFISPLSALSLIQYVISILFFIVAAMLMLFFISDSLSAEKDNIPVSGSPIKEVLISPLIIILISAGMGILLADSIILIIGSSGIHTGYNSNLTVFFGGTSLKTSLSVFTHLLSLLFLLLIIVITSLPPLAAILTTISHPGTKKSRGGET
jgi:hypothetical protein